MQKSRECNRKITSKTRHLAEETSPSSKIKTRMFNFARRTCLRRQVARFWSDVPIHTRQHMIKKSKNGIG